MDINTKINIISGIVLPIIGMFGATIGFLIGIYKERNNIDWKENRDALKCAYSCCEELKRSVLKNIAFNIDLINELKNKKWFNINNVNIRTKVFNILEFQIFDAQNRCYIENKKDEFIKLIDEILPLIIQELK